MNKYKRVITLVLALLMVSSIFFGLFAAIASAVTLEINQAGGTTANIKASGAPAATEFTTYGLYSFKKIDVTAKTFSVTFNNNTKDNVAFAIDTDKKVITYGGITIERKDPTGNFIAWSDTVVAADDFAIEIQVKATTNPNPTKPIITYSKTVQYQGFGMGGNDPNGSNENGKSRSFQSMYEIKRNNDVNILLTISDPNGGVIDPATVYFIPESGSFRSISTSEVQDDVNQATRIYSRIKTLSNGKQALEIDVIRLRYTGKGNTFSFTYGYTLDDGTDVRAVDYTADFTIPECVEYSKKPETPETDPKDLDPLLPHIIVDKYSYGTNQVIAGEEFLLDLTITNTSPGYDIQNVIMTIAPPKEGLSLTSSSNTYYIPNLDKKKSIDKTINIRALPDAKPQSHDVVITFDFQYVANEKRTTLKDTQTIAIPVTQVDRFSVNPIESPAYLYVGDEYPISAVFVNKGRSAVYNVSAEIRGNIPNPGQKQFIGNVESGKESSADFFMLGKEAGEMSGEVVVTYEDSNMNTKEVIMPFSVMVQAMDFGPPPDIDLNPIPETDLPADGKEDSKKVSLGFAGLIIASLTAFVNIKKVKAKRVGEDNEDI